MPSGFAPGTLPEKLAESLASPAPEACAAPASTAPACAALTGLIGESPAMQRLHEQIRRAATSDATVLITGESGTGKELVAQALHDLSPRHAAPFIAVNCGAISPSLIEAELLGHEKGSFTGADRQRIGYFERAAGGTIFLDEVTEMPLAMQVRLLRVLEAREVQRVGGNETIPVNFRVVAASNRDIEREVREGRFREDLMYRLAVLPIRVPSLRARGSDIEQLAQHFLDRLNAAADTHKTFSRGALKRLPLQLWPGNVRELKNAVGRAFILADHVLDIPTARTTATPRNAVDAEGCIAFGVGTPLADAEQALIMATLAHHNGDKPATARTLGISLKTLYNRLDAYRSAGVEASLPSGS